MSGADYRVCPACERAHGDPYIVRNVMGDIILGCVHRVHIDATVPDTNYRGWFWRTRAKVLRASADLPRIRAGV